ncbi:MAG: hypothetical protein JWQ79_3763 [Mucilaginibacter sp.]|nr:hypothetical protein [Mucilaginibacter sp.]
MRLYLILFLSCLYTFAFGQSNFNDLIKKIKITSLPYSSESEQDRLWYVYSDKQIKLHLNDSSFVVNKLKSIPQTIVNPNGGSGFGNLDFVDGFEEASPLGDASARIAILRVIKNNTQTGYILHIVVGGGIWDGILACVNYRDDLISWIYSNGSANGGNPHGNIYRSFKISNDGVIHIEEGSWGDNTETYGFTASYKVVKNKFVLLKRKLSK